MAEYDYEKNINNIYGVLKKYREPKDHSQSSAIKKTMDAIKEGIDDIRVRYNALDASIKFARPTYLPYPSIEYQPYSARVASLFANAEREATKIQNNNEKLKKQRAEGFERQMNKYKTKTENLFDETTFEKNGKINPNSELAKQYNFLFQANNKRYPLELEEADNTSKEYKDLLALQAFSQKARTGTSDYIDKLFLENRKKEDSKVKKGLESLKSIDEEIKKVSDEIFILNIERLEHQQNEKIKESREMFEGQNLEKFRESIKERISEYNEAFERYKKAEQLNAKSVDRLSGKKQERFKEYREQMEERRDYYKNILDGYKKFNEETFEKYDERIKTIAPEDANQLNEAKKELHEKIRSELEESGKKFGGELEADPKIPYGKFETFLSGIEFFNRAVNEIEKQNDERIANFKTLQEKLAGDESIRTSDVKKDCLEQMRGAFEEMNETKKVMKAFSKNFQEITGPSFVEAIGNFSFSDIYNSVKNIYNSNILPDGAVKRALYDFKFSEFGKSVNDVYNARKVDPLEEKERIMNKALASGFYAIYPEWREFDENGQDPLYKEAAKRNITFTDPSSGTNVLLTSSNSNHGPGATRLHLFKIELMEEKLGKRHSSKNNETEILASNSRGNEAERMPSIPVPSTITPPLTPPPSYKGVVDLMEKGSPPPYQATKEHSPNTNDKKIQIDMTKHEPANTEAAGRLTKAVRGDNPTQVPPPPSKAPKPNAHLTPPASSNQR